ncbi:MAG: glycosyltransferase, partial [Planctomycetota bacterium]|nr:glycosyltransferase [Planctomycetota bacterium]
DLLVHTSLREGLARALPQALLAGKPVISYDVDGAREVVIPDETGILLEPRSIQPLAAAITELANDETRRQRLGRAGQQNSRQRFCHEEMTRQIRQLYQQVLDS